MMYVSMIFSAAFMGYSIGTAPIVSYHFGAQNHSELQSLLRKESENGRHLRRSDGSCVPGPGPTLWPPFSWAMTQS